MLLRAITFSETIAPWAYFEVFGQKKAGLRRNFWWKITVFVDMAAKQTRLGSANISWAAFTSAKQEHGRRDINLHGFNLWVQNC